PPRLRLPAHPRRESDHARRREAAPRIAGNRRARRRLQARAARSGNPRRGQKRFLVQQISVSDGKVFLLFHPESPVKVEKLLELIRKQKSRFRLAPDGRLSFTPRSLEWEPLMAEIAELLGSIHDRPAPEAKLQPAPLPA